MRRVQLSHLVKQTASLRHASRLAELGEDVAEAFLVIHATDHAQFSVVDIAGGVGCVGNEIIFLGSVYVEGRVLKRGRSVDMIVIMGPRVIVMTVTQRTVLIMSMTPRVVPVTPRTAFTTPTTPHTLPMSVIPCTQRLGDTH